MAQVFFHCSSAQEAWIDRCGAAVDDLAGARDQATLVADGDGEEIFTLPFAALLGKPH